MSATTTLESISTQADYALKDYFSPEKLKHLGYTDHPAYALLPKNEDAGGDPHVIHAVYANPVGGRSATYDTAVTNSTKQKGVKFLGTWTENYDVVDVPNLWIKISRGDLYAFVSLLTGNTEGAIMEVTNDQATALFRTGTGARGAIGTVSTDTITLSEIEEVTAFEVDMELEASANENGSSPRTGTATITAIDRDLGTLTSDSNWSAQITSIAAADYLFVEGDRAGAAGTANNKKITGFAGWVPGTAPASGDAHFGVDRSTDATRLGGMRLSGSGKSKEEALVDALQRGARESARFTHAFVSPAAFADIEKTLGTRVTYEDVDVAGVGFKGITVSGGANTAVLMADGKCQNTIGWLVDINTWYLYSPGVPFVFMEPDNEGHIIQLEGDDAKRIVVKSYGNLACIGPGKNLRLTW